MQSAVSDARDWARSTVPCRWQVTGALPSVFLSDLRPVFLPLTSIAGVRGHKRWRKGHRQGGVGSRYLSQGPQTLLRCGRGVPRTLTVDPKVIPRNTFQKYKVTCWEYGIHRIHFTEISLYRYCRVKPWKALTLKDPLQRPPRGECRVASGLGVRRGAQSTSITHALQDPRKHFPLWAQQNTRGLQRPACPGVLTKGWVCEGC